MKQKILVGIFAILMCFIFLMPNQSLAVTSTSEYTIQSYNINMIVNEDNTFDITENITVYFNVSKHGIFRKIPLKNSVTRIDGSKSNNRAKITNISVSENYTTSNEKGYKVIKIGDANSTLTGKHSYTIKYKYNIGKDPLKNVDELYFNLIGDEWDANISNVSFTITMPKSFDKSTLGFSSGNVGSTNSSNVTYNVNGNTITGNTTNTLYAGQALTVRLTLPEGYFVGASSNIDTFSIFVIVLCAVFVLIADRLWAKYGKDDEVIETVEFYPPEGYNSAEIEFWYRGSVSTKGIISLLIYLANKGYLKIEEISGGLNNNKIKLNNEERRNADLKIQELKNKIQEEKLKDINSPKIRILENSLNIYENIDKPIDYELSQEEEKLINKAKKNSKDKINIVKLKEYDGTNIYEKIFFEGLFINSNMNSVTISQLYNTFYITLNRIKSKINSKENKNKIFESSASGKGKYLILMIIAVFILITVKPVIEYGEAGTLLFALLFPRNRLYCIDRKSYRCNKNA